MHDLVLVEARPKPEEYIHLRAEAADADRYLALYLKAHSERRVSNFQELLGPYRRPEDLAH